MTRDPDIDFKQLLGVFYHTAEVMAGQEFKGEDTYLAEAESLALKIAYHLSTLLFIRGGTRLTDVGGISTGFFDFSSSALLARSAFETYLTFNFIFLESESQRERQFRYFLWCLGGLRDRQRIVVTSNEGREQLQREKCLCETYRSQIMETDIYQTLPNESKKKARRGEWRLGKSWADLAVAAGGNEKYFVGLYSYLSSYAHSGYLSVLQIAEARDKVTQFRLGEMHIVIGLNLMSYFLVDYAKLFPRVREFIDSNKNYRELIEFWHWTNEDFELFHDVI